MKEYIEREMLLELYDNTDELNIDNFHVPIEVVRQNILDQPAADVREVVHAKWENIEPYTAINGQYLKAQVCSNCDALFVSGGNEPYNSYPYCCVCGAKMDL